MPKEQKLCGNCHEDHEGRTYCNDEDGMTFAPKEQKGWEERFDEFGEIFTLPHGEYGTVKGKIINGFDYVAKCDTEPLKSFIRDLLAEKEKEILEELYNLMQFAFADDAILPYEKTKEAIKRIMK